MVVGELTFSWSLMGRESIGTQGTDLQGALAGTIKTSAKSTGAIKNKNENSILVCLGM